MQIRKDYLTSLSLGDIGMVIEDNWDKNLRYFFFICFFNF